MFYYNFVDTPLDFSLQTVTCNAVLLAYHVIKCSACIHMSDAYLYNKKTYELIYIFEHTSHKTKEKFELSNFCVKIFSS